MKRIGTIGLTLGVAAMAVASLLFVAKPADWSDTTLRAWHLLRWVGLALPVPEHPALIGPTLAFLNLPLWQGAAGIGLMLTAVSLLFGREPSKVGEPPLILNGFVVDPRIAALMRRPDWQAQRTDAAWMERFPGHGGRTVPFVELCGPEWAIRENAAIRDPENASLLGRPDPAAPPGDVDPAAAYLIGFTASADAGIYVDLRARGGGRIIYDNHHDKGFRHVIAFDTISDFVEFYLAQHGS